MLKGHCVKPSLLLLPFTAVLRGLQRTMVPLYLQGSGSGTPCEYQKTQMLKSIKKWCKLHKRDARESLKWKDTFRQVCGIFLSEYITMWLVKSADKGCMNMAGPLFSDRVNSVASYGN